MTTQNENNTQEASSVQRLVRPFVAGDVVRHGPTGEEWVLACDEERGEVMPCGWPMCIAKAADCVLVTAATNTARAQMLTTWSEKRDSESSRDWRTLTARRQWPNKHISNI